MKEKNEICIFISSPNNVRLERDCVEEVVKRINTSLSDQLNIYLRVKRWENLPPSAGNAQEIINKEIGPYDIFIGIMAERFGSPTDKSESGTQEEFETAYKVWSKHTGVYEIMFYFREIQTLPENSDDAKQLFNVLRFREEISSKIMYKIYKKSHEFENFLRDDLELIVRKLAANLEKISPENRAKKKSQYIKTVEIDNIVKLWGSIEKPSFFIPGGDGREYCFYRARIQTSNGFIKNSKGEDELCTNFITIYKDPIRPFDIQIGETRSIRTRGNPVAIPDLTNMDLNSVKDMYPFIHVEGYKWIRMVLAELSTDKEVLDFIYKVDKDDEVKNIVAKNPSASSDLQKKECKFCSDDFKNRRLISSGSSNTYIIHNDFPYGPYFHYIAFPKRAVHAWQDLELEDIYDLNLTIWKFLNDMRNNDHLFKKSSGVFIGLNSSIKHLVMGTRTRTSAGASISHVHKQMWGMTPGSINLGNHLDELCSNRDYLEEYYNFLNNENMVLYQDKYVCLYVPYGQISTHELQIMLKSCKTHYLSLLEEEVVSLSIAETIAISLLDKLGIHSFNEIIITLPFDRISNNFRLIVCFITREVDLAVSELNHLFVVDSYPEDTRDMLIPIKDSVIKDITSRAISLKLIKQEG